MFILATFNVDVDDIGGGAHVVANPSWGLVSGSVLTMVFPSARCPTERNQVLLSNLPPVTFRTGC